MSKKRVSLLFYVLSFIIGILSIFLYYVTRNKGWSLSILTNSDILYFPTLFKDIFVDGYKFEGWHIPAAPNFFRICFCILF